MGFSVDLLPDGTLKFVANPSTPMAATQQVRLTKERTKRFYDAMVRIVNETDRKKIVGAVQDGWDVTATVELDGRKRELTYDRFGSIQAISPEFRAIKALIEKDVPGIKLTSAELADLMAEEDDKIVLPPTFEKGTLHVRGSAGGRDGRRWFDVEVFPDGFLRVETQPFREGHKMSRGQLTKEQTKEFYDAMVKVIRRVPRKTGGRNFHGWSVTASINFDKEGMKQQQQRSFSEFESIREMSLQFDVMFELVEKALPKSRIFQATSSH